MAWLNCLISILHVERPYISWVLHRLLFQVLIVLHVPMGVSEAEDYPYLRNSTNNRLYDLISSNGDVIIGALTAHSHNDAFKIFFDDGKNGHLRSISHNLCVRKTLHFNYSSFSYAHSNRPVPYKALSCKNGILTP